MLPKQGKPLVGRQLGPCGEVPKLAAVGAPLTVDIWVGA